MQEPESPLKRLTSRPVKDQIVYKLEYLFDLGLITMIVGMIYTIVTSTWDLFNAGAAMLIISNLAIILLLRH